MFPKRLPQHVHRRGTQVTGLLLEALFAASLAETQPKGGASEIGAAPARDRKYSPLRSPHFAFYYLDPLRRGKLKPPVAQLHILFPTGEAELRGCAVGLH
jgi:hypothetical protein